MKADLSAWSSRRYGYPIICSTAILTRGTISDYARQGQESGRAFAQYGAERKVVCEEYATSRDAISTANVSFRRIPPQSL